VAPLNELTLGYFATHSNRYSGAFIPILTPISGQVIAVTSAGENFHERWMRGSVWDDTCGNARGLLQVINRNLAGAPDILPVRGVISSDPWRPRAVEGAVRVLAIAPRGGAGLDVLSSALQPRINAGEITWLNPIEGSAARPENLFGRGIEPANDTALVGSHDSRRNRFEQRFSQGFLQGRLFIEQRILQYGGDVLG
jgi:hypothetical protein